MEREYIQELNATYESFFGDHHQGAVVLPIDTDHLDYVHSSQSLRHVENRIRQTLQLPPFQQELPLESRAD
jgi:deoxyadenosine/deoxycytidine kinase